MKLLDKIRFHCALPKAKRSESFSLTSRFAMEDLAGLARVLSVLLASGLSAASAWRHACSVSTGYGPQFEAARTAASRGEDVGLAILRSNFSSANSEERSAWLALAAAWWIGVRSGANLAQALQSLAATFGDLARARKEALVALSGPAATARLVGVLPLFSLLFGLALGFNPLQILLFTVPGWFVLGLGLGLMYLARRWSRRMVAKATPRDVSPGLDCALSVIALGGGGSIDSARALVNRALGLFDLSSTSARAIDRLYGLSCRSGAPAIGLLQSEGEQARYNHQAQARQEVQRLAIRLMLPLGLCVLPAFMLIGVVPLLMSILSGGIF